MKKFILHSLLFIGLMITIILLSLFFIPNKKIENNSLYANIDKHKRLDSLPSPKIVFVGGSNLSFGLDSKRIEDSLHIPVVNMGLHAGFGLKYMINEVKPSIKKGDVVILSPEYHHFFDDNVLNGEKVLVALIFDVNRKNLKYITFMQALHLLPLTVDYSVSKLMRKQMDVMEDNQNNDFEKNYNRYSFNKYGDEVMHWEYPNETIHHNAENNLHERVVSQSSLKLIKDFNKFINRKGGSLIVIPPAFMKYSFQNYTSIITQIEMELQNQNTPFSIAPQSFVFSDNLFFNTDYHLNKQGVEQRTDSIIKMLQYKKASND